MSTDVNRLEEILKQLTPIQLKFVAVRPHVKYDYEAAEQIGTSKEVVSRWEEKSIIDEAVKLMLQDGVKVAAEILRRSLSKAAQELADELDHRSVNVRHKAAIQVLDRQMGKSPQPVTGANGEALEIVVKYVDAARPD